MRKFPEETYIKVSEKEAQESTGVMRGLNKQVNEGGKKPERCSG